MPKQKNRLSLNIVARLRSRARRFVWRLTSKLPAAPNPMLEEIQQIYASKARYVTRVTQPLLLISQVQRSGGTLLSQLFDNHPECYAHPAELDMGYLKKYNKYFYPAVALDDDPAVWFARVAENRMRELFVGGYRKFPGSAVYNKEDVFPFYFLPNLQREIFLRDVAQQRPASQRDVLDAYFTSYFNAWLDYQGWRQGKRYITAFTPRLATEPGNAARFFADYPDGLVLHVVRDPKGWYASSHRKDPRLYPTPQSALPVWSQSAQAMADNKAQFGDRVRIVNFETLLNDTRGVMARIAEWAGLTWDETLVEPTFQGQPIKANTAFTTTQYGVIDEPRRRSEQLNAEDLAVIDQSPSGALYEQVIGLCE